MALSYKLQWAAMMAQSYSVLSRLILWFPFIYEIWGHFTQFGDELRQVFEAQDIVKKFVGSQVVRRDQSSLIPVVMVVF